MIDELALAVVKEKWGARAPVTVIIEAYEAAKLAALPADKVEHILRAMHETWDGSHEAWKTEQREKLRAALAAMPAPVAYARVQSPSPCQCYSCKNMRGEV